ncbi:MAG: 4-hydroxy-3-methylbut-2-enyl diphosphate reductase [Elusimicrobia bacterium ADurb.Bin231]|nr:MAG: 4-hydroxy-3-methylbut-2-enyl diphosphate reductase [Elusimicrobia bacterium ADurb.Bin231]
MKIIVAKNSGFCFGVRRAINLAINLSEKVGRVYTIGPIIHNPQVVEELFKDGIIAARNHLTEIKGKNVVIRAHGIPLDVLNYLCSKKMKILDATCPYVTRSKSYAEELMRDGYTVAIIGNPDHPEIKYIHSYVPGNSIILKSPEDVKKIKFLKKIGVITQTTQSPENFIEITKKLLHCSNEFKIFNTICPDAIKRQKETEELSAKSDLMIIIGGKNSANTQRLAVISRKKLSETHHIETAGELKKHWFRGVKTVGIVTGASTPDKSIKDVVDTLKKFGLQ